MAHPVVFTLVELAIGVGAAGLMYVAWTHRDRPAGVPMVLMAAAATVYAIASGLVPFATDPTVWHLLVGIRHPLTVVIAVGSFFLAAAVTQRGSVDSRAVQLVLSSVVLVSFAVAATDPLYGLFIGSRTAVAEGAFVPVPGPLFWVNTLVALGIILASIVLLVVDLGSARGVYREQIAALVVALLIGVGFFLWETLSPIHPVFNLAVLGIFGWCCVSLWAVFRVDFLETAPIARQTLMDSMDDAVFAIDGEGRVVDANPTAAELFGVDTDAIGTSAEAVFDAYPSLLGALDVPGGSDCDTRSREVAIEMDGRTRHFDVTVSPVRGGRPRQSHRSGRGQSIGRTVVIREITDRKRQETALERSRELLRHTERLADTGGWELDVADDTLQWTAGTYAIHDIEDPSAFDPSLESTIDFYHPSDRLRIETFIDRCIEDGDPFDEEIRMTTAADRLRWIRVAGEPETRDGAVIRVRGAIQDVTDHKRREQRLERQNERLDQFASVVSHDLRNPLNIARGRLELAREEHDGDGEHLAAVDRAHERMSDLIEDLLTLARTGEQLDELERVQLAETARLSWVNVDAPAGILEIETDLTVSADRGLLRRLLGNLFRNAIEHGGEGVTVTVGSLEDGRGFYVEDDGSGIPEGKREQVFESGYSTSNRGTGLGLSIVREVAEVHGWGIAVVNSERGGARFEITGVECGRERNA